MTENPLGLFTHYGHFIISICLIVWGILYTYLDITINGEQNDE